MILDNLKKISKRDNSLLNLMQPDIRYINKLLIQITYVIIFGIQVARDNLSVI